MTWFLLAVALVGMYIVYRQSQSTAPVPVELQATAVDGDITAIEYFWRPG